MESLAIERCSGRHKRCKVIIFHLDLRQTTLISSPGWGMVLQHAEWILEISVPSLHVSNRGARPPGGCRSYRPRATQPYDAIHIVTSFRNEFITIVMEWYSPIEWTLVSKLHSLLLFSIPHLIVSDVHVLQMHIHYCKVNHTTDIMLKNLNFFFSFFIFPPMGSFNVSSVTKCFRRTKRLILTFQSTIVTIFWNLTPTDCS